MRFFFGFEPMIIMMFPMTTSSSSSSSSFSLSCRAPRRHPCRRHGHGNLSSRPSTTTYGKKKKKVGGSEGDDSSSGPGAVSAQKKLTPKERRALAKQQKAEEQQARLDAIEAAAEARKKPCDDVNVVMWTLSLATSFQKATDRQLLRGVPVTEAARALYETQDFVLLSHSLTTPDEDLPPEGPVFNYGNELGQELFQYSWDELMTTSSSKTVKADNDEAMEARKELMQRMESEDYAEFDGVRVDKEGNEFLIEHGILWNVRAPPKASDNDDEPMEGKRKEAPKGQLIGQAAVFWKWTPQPDGEVVEKAGLPPLQPDE